jgi:phosphoglycerol geranylgeranyltransferase
MDYMLNRRSIKNWKHVTKLDPDKKISDSFIAKITDSGTDAILIGGTLGVDKKKMSSMIDRVLEYDIPVLIEPSNPENIVENSEVYYFVPTVMNSTSPEMIVGLHCKWMKSKFNDWDRVFPEAYIVLNPDSSVARYSKSNCNLTKDQVVSYAKVAQNYFKLPIVYLEYSGKFGDTAVVKAVSDEINGDTALFYGGGISDREKALQMAKFATIVVGNVIYDDMESFLDTIP